MKSTGQGLLALLIFAVPAFASETTAPASEKGSAGAGANAAHGQAEPAKAGGRSVHSVALPGAPVEGVFMDYLAYDRSHHSVWVPAGNTGSVDVIDTTNDKLTRIEGFQTKEMERNGTKRTVGPSSATVGDGVVYIGNRGNSNVCEVDAVSLKIGACVDLGSMPDGLAYVASTKEVWVTTPRDQTIVILDASKKGALTRKGKIVLEGDPEGYAVDDARGLFYTNLEDKDRTLAIGIKKRAVKSTWTPGCGEAGPRGLAIDHARNILMVACTDRVVALDAGHNGKQKSSGPVGEGIDNIDYVETRHELYVGAGKAAKLAILGLDSKGALTSKAMVDTAPGARNPVATDEGVAYLTDAKEGKILVVGAAASH